MTQALHPEVVTAGDMLEGEAGAHPWLDAFLLFSKMIPQQQPFRFFWVPLVRLKASLTEFACNLSCGYVYGR